MSLLEGIGRVAGHLARAPSGVPPSEQASQPARATAARQRVVDEDAEAGSEAVWLELETHAVGPDDQQSRLAHRLPALSARRLMVRHDRIHGERKPESMPRELKTRADPSTTRDIGPDLHAAATHHP